MKNSYLKSNIEIGLFEKNIGDMLLKRVSKYSNSLVLRERTADKLLEVTWENLFKDVKKLISGLISLEVQKGDRLATLSKDCYQILALELACMSLGLIYVPLYTGYFPKQIEYVISHSDPKYIVLDGQEELEKVLSTTATGRIEKYFMINYDEKYLESTRIFDFKLLFRDENIDFESIINQVEPEDHSMIIYTSGGATGIVKGVEFTHKNILGHQKALEQVLNIEHSDRVLSYYPWHHTMGITEQFLALYAGACLIIDRRPGIHPNTLADDLKTYKPTVYFGSGKVFNDIVFQMENNQKIREAFFHDEVKFAFASSSPIKGIIEYFDNKNVPLIQGWGLTETLQYVTVNTERYKSPSFSGFPIPDMEIKLEGEFDEIFVKGIGVALGYYKEPERTESYFSKDGWFKTGDSGFISEKGLRVNGRIDSLLHIKDNIVFASKIEQVIESGSALISNCVVVGDTKDYASALLFVNEGVLKSIYKERNGYSIPLPDMLDEQDVIDMFKDEIKKINETYLSEYEKIKMFTLIETPISVKKGEKSTSSKVIRKQVIQNYNYLVDAFYNDSFPEIKSRIIEI